MSNTKFESSIRQIMYPQQSVYNMLSDLSNIERVKDRMSDDRLQDLTFPHLLQKYFQPLKFHFQNSQQYPYPNIQQHFLYYLI